MPAKKVFDRELTTAEKFYISQHNGDKKVTDIARDLEIPPDVVKEYAKSLPAQHKPRKIANFAVRDDEKSTSISVSMTPGQSQADDEDAEKSNRNDEFFKQRVRNGIHIIDPSKPIR